MEILCSASIHKIFETPKTKRPIKRSGKSAFVKASSFICGSKNQASKEITGSAIKLLKPKIVSEEQNSLYNTPRKQHKKNQFLIPKELRYIDYFKG